MGCFQDGLSCTDLHAGNHCTPCLSCRKYALQARRAAVVKAALYVASAVMTSRCQVQLFRAEYKLCKSLPISALQSKGQDSVLISPKWKSQCCYHSVVCHATKTPCGRASLVMCPVQAREGAPSVAGKGTQLTCAFAAPPGGFHCCSGALLLMAHALCESP